VHAARESGKLVLSGTVVDDAGRPALGAQVSVAFARAGEPLASIAISPSATQPCGAAGPAPEVVHSDRIVLTTDEVARFCVRVALGRDRYTARLESGSSGLVDGAKLDLPIDLALAPIGLRFDPERSLLSLDEETTSLDVVASTEDDGVTASAAGLELSLWNEADSLLGRATTDASGRARFAVDTEHLGPPGKGELRVLAGDSASAGAASRVMRVERRTRVDVVAPDASAGRLPAGWPEDGIAVHLLVAPRCARRGCRGSPSGTIEASIGPRTIVGAAPVEHGEAHLLISFAAPRADALANQSTAEVAVTFRFVPDAPWFQPEGDIVLMQPVRGPSSWTKLPLVLAAGVAVAWLALARLPPRWRVGRPPIRPPAPVRALEHVVLVRKAASAEGWTGRVADAQDGLAIAQARVAIERRGFDQVHVVSETTSDRDGAFALLPADVRPGDELDAEGPLHAPVRHPLPPSGELTVALVLRKRALLDRLVAWARRQGGAYVAPPDPTPAHVRRAAGSNVAVARWANAVEEAVYGDGAVDEQGQADVDRLEPRSDER
jgi:hypothetical protein